MKQRLFIIGALLAFAAACTIVNGLEVAHETVVGGPDVIEGGNPSKPGEDGPVDTCMHARPVGPPSTGAGGVQFFISAVSSLDIGTRDSGTYERMGLDLDNACSCQTAGPTCISPQPIFGFEAGCDDDGGVDNVATSLFQQAFNLSLGTLELQDDFSSALRAGAPGVLVHVSGYNGQANDPDVSVAILISPGLESGERPTFEPGEVWLAGENDTQPLSGDDAGRGPGPGAYLSTMTNGAWVTDNQLVARGVIRLPLLAGLAVTFKDGYLIGEIAHPDGGRPYLASGTITGRAPLNDVLRAVGGVERPTGSGVHLCDTENQDDKNLYATLKAAICASPDITQDSRNTPDASCDALSFAFKFTAVPAVLSSTTAPPIEVTYCAGADIDCPDAN